ncbi:MAG: glycosyltransferase family 39 protein, partial [Vulcanimicrobiaceae bacterium]
MLRPSPPKPETLPSFFGGGGGGRQDGASKPSRWFDAIAAGAFAAAGLALRVPLMGRGIWRDEGSTYADVTAKTLGAMLAHLPVTEFTPPLYFIVMFFWTRLAGVSEVALRAPSLVFGIATIVVMYALGRLVAGRFGAIFCATAAVLSPLSVAMHVEARSYALAMLLSALTIYAFAAAMMESRRRLNATACAALAACGFLLIATHFTGFVIVGALAASAIVNAAACRTRGSYALAGSAVAACVAGLPLLRWFRSAAERLAPLRDVHDGYLVPRVADHLNAFSPFGSMQYQLNVTFAAGIVIWLITLGFRRRDVRDALIAAMLAVTVFGIGSSIARGLPMERHLAPYAPAVWSLMALLLSLLGSWLRPSFSLRWLAAIPVAYVIAGGLVSYPRAYAHAARPVSGVRDAVAVFAACCGGKPLLVVAAPDFIGPTVYYYTHGDTAIALRGIGTWESPQFYDLDARRFDGTDFVRAQAVRVRDLARALGARTAIVVSRDPGGYYRAGVERS